MLGGYQRTTLQGLDCGANGCGSCDRGGLGDLLDPSTWGPADWAIAAGAAWIGWKVFKGQKQKRYARVVRRRLGAE